MSGVQFDAVLRPNRSLPPLGFLALMAALSALGFAAGIGFALLGAWPVLGFLGLDVLLVYVAFRLNYRAARRYERVRLDARALTVERADPRGAQARWSFPAFWVRVSMDDPPRHASHCVLSSHGRSLAVGSFLSPPERLEFARALRAALARVRAA